MGIIRKVKDYWNSLYTRGKVILIILGVILLVLILIGLFILLEKVIFWFGEWIGRTLGIPT